MLNEFLIQRVISRFLSLIFIINFSILHYQFIIHPYFSNLLIQETGDKYFWTAIINLDQALKTSPASYNLRFLIIKFLNQSGAVGVSNSFHGGLELKHVQLDSLGYVLSRHIQTCGHFHSTIGLFSSTLKFFNANYKDVCITCFSFFDFFSLKQRSSHF